MKYSRNIPDSTNSGRRPCAAGSARALTFLEMIISLAIMAVVFAAILPQFRNIQNSWSSRQGAAEALQNGRVLIDHLNRNLSSAVLITAVSDPDVVNGFIEYEATDDITYRYEVSAGGYVQYGAVGMEVKKGKKGEEGGLSELAGPVDRLQFTCYDAYDLDTTTTEPEAIRCVQVAATLVNAAELGQDKAFSTKAYLRTNGVNHDVVPGVPYEYDKKKGKSPVLIEVAGNRFLCVYAGDKDRGSATILAVDPDTWLISQGVSVVYDADKGKDPAVCTLEAGSDEDTSRFLVAYQGDGDDGTAVILNVDLNTWDISMETPFEYDTEKGKHAALVQVDDTNYLCAYSGGPEKDHGWAVVLTVDENTFEITKQTPFEFDTVKGKTPVLVDIGTGKMEYLCVYSGDGDDGWAVVLTVDKQTLEITKGTPYEYDIFKGKTPAIKRLNKWKYLCAYSGGPKKDHGWAVVLNVDDQLDITKGVPFEFDAKKGKTPALGALDFLPKGVKKRSDFLCCYSGDKDHGRAVVLRVDETTWQVTKGNPLDYDDIDYDVFFEFEDDKAKTPALCEIDETHFLCAYAGGPKKDHGWVVVFDLDNPLLP